MSKILFIDDDLLTLQLMKTLAEILGHQSFSCSEPKDAIQHVDQTNPDLILIDINMEDINGFQIVQQIRQHALIGSMPVLILSAGDPQVEEKNALEAGANGFISKPLSISGLDCAVKQYTRHERLVCCPAF